MGKLVTINRMEIFRAGKWNGFDFTEEDLRQMERNFNLLQNTIRPKLKITHREDQESLAGLASYGDIVNIYTDKVNGELRLYCNIERVPDEVANWIREGRFSERSIEMWLYHEVDGAKYQNVITAVSLLGNEIPAVAGMSPVLAKESKDGKKFIDISDKGNVPQGMTAHAFAFDDRDRLQYSEATNSSQRGGEKAMDEQIKKMQERIDRLEGEKKALETKMADQSHAAELSTFKTQVASLTQEIENLKVFKADAEKLAKENKELKDKQEMAEKEAAKTAKAAFAQRVDSILEKFKKAGKIVPAVEEKAKELLMSLSGDAKVAEFSEKVEGKAVKVSYTQVDLFEEILKALPKVVNFGEEGEEGDEEEEESEENGSAAGSRQFKHGSDTYTVANESLSERAKKIMGTEKCTYAVALGKASAQFKAEGKSQSLKKK